MAIDKTCRYATSFFKLILVPPQLEELRIPREFMKYHGKDLSVSDSVSLKIPTTGARWEVKLILSQNGDDTLLQKGWPEFAEFYSISIGYFLVFRYTACCHCFHVFIMDESACEIGYPAIAVEANLGTCRTSVMRKRKTANFSELVGSSKKAPVAIAPKKIYHFNCDITWDEKKRVEDYPINHPSFVVKIKPTYNNEMRIPREFMKHHGKDLSVSDSVSLKVPTTEARWEVKLILSQNGDDSLFQKGWPEFVEFYSISIGYFLLFEYTASCRCFHVFIMDCSACEIEYPVVAVDTNPGTCSGNPKRKRKDTNYSKLPAQVAAGPSKIYCFRCDLTSDEKKRVEEYPTDGPAFVVKVKPSHLSKAKMIIPAEFVEKHLKKEKRIIFINLVNVTGKKWPVKCVVEQKREAYDHRLLTKGLRDFAKDNQLRVGDICIFGLIKGGKKKIFKVGVLPTLVKKYPIIKLEIDSD